MAGALLNVRMESNQLAMQKAVLENKLNQTDAEFALAMAESNDDSFPFNKEQVEKYYEMKAKEVMCHETSITFPPTVLCPNRVNMYQPVFYFV